MQIQRFLSIVGEHFEDEEKGDHQAIGVLGIAAIAMGEKVGSEMALRMLDGILQYCEVTCRRGVPLALALLSVSHPEVGIIETLSKLTHDNDEFVSQNAVFALGIVGAGTNNSRIAQMLRDLAIFYAKEPNHLFLVRAAQGLLHLGKGLLSLSPYQSDGLLMSKVGVCGLLGVLFCFLDAKHSKLSVQFI